MQVSVSKSPSTSLYRVLSRLFLISLIGLALLLWSAPQGVWAQDGGVDTEAGETLITNPKTRTNLVSATVRDNTPPTAPILISPNNGSYVTINTPSFVWKESIDERSMDHYEFIVDGQLLFIVPITPTTNANFTLTYDPISKEYTLIPKQGLSEGTHTWKIRAIDSNNLGTDSATWTFIIDTQAPSFVVTNVGTEAVTISSQDTSTIPTQPLVLDANEPLITATGEADSTVQLTLTIPGDPTQTFTSIIGIDGSWSLQLGFLPRDVIMMLEFVVTDKAGNVSVLSGVEFIIPSPSIVYPPTSPQATPLITPGPSPIIEIPIIPPKEIINEVVQEVVEDFGPSLQTATQVLPAGFRRVVSDTLLNLAPYSALIISVLFPLTSALAIASQFGWQISPDLFIKILQALGLLPLGKPKGMVFDSQTYEPVPFALLSFQSQDESQPFLEAVVTNFEGVYTSLQLPKGQYKIIPRHQDFTFPTVKTKPAYLAMFDYYKGETFTITQDNQQPIVLIPMDHISEKTGFFSKSRLRLALARLSRRMSNFIFPLFIISGLLASVFPTIWNTAIFIFYCFLMAHKALGWFKSPLITGQVIDDLGAPMERVVMRLADAETQELIQLVSTDKKGKFAFFVPKAKYQLSAYKPGYVWYEEKAPLSLYEVDATHKSQVVVASLKPVAAISESDLFA